MISMYGSTPLTLCLCKQYGGEITWARNSQIKEYTLKDGEKRFMFKFYLGTNSLT